MWLISLAQRGNYTATKRVDFIMFFSQALLLNLFLESLKLEKGKMREEIGCQKL